MHDLVSLLDDSDLGLDLRLICLDLGHEWDLLALQYLLLVLTWDLKLDKVQ